MADLGSLSRAELEDLEARVVRALAGGRPQGLDILGYGEISTVVALEAAAGRFACKRLPPFPEPAGADAYRRLFDEYWKGLAVAGVAVVPSELHRLEDAAGHTIVYCIQPTLAADRLGPRHLAGCSPQDADRLFESLLDIVLGAIGPRTGLDAQLSNWVRDAGRWHYLDVTTPLLRDDMGHERLDAGLFLAALPALLRRPVRRFLLRGILETYYDPRRAVVDLLGNLHKERLAEHVPRWAAIASQRLSPAITADEVRAYYLRDARLWELLLRLRRLDRLWQLRVRRRVYPFLLPGPIDR